MDTGIGTIWCFLHFENKFDGRVRASHPAATRSILGVPKIFIHEIDVAEFYQQGWWGGRHSTEEKQRSSLDQFKKT